MQQKRYVYEEGYDGMYGYFQCLGCQVTFFATMCETPPHLPECSKKDEGYQPCTYHFGPQEVSKVLEAAQKHGETYKPEGTPLTLQLIKEYCPEAIPKN